MQKAKFVIASFFFFIKKLQKTQFVFASFFYKKNCKKQNSFFRGFFIKKNAKNKIRFREVFFFYKKNAKNEKLTRSHEIISQSNCSIFENGHTKRTDLWIL